uniref:Aminopeptidase n=1 Tax=Geotrypetes seraphini TaxID=260995 RepID=A0A6P8PI98_GEOSA|nr:aminopeptidase N-like [Geotrypetes seraphini]XP_033775376.1 aminopeptidase N-like [Geotrypetes seraphini]XP_033775377.1 aminopeptidase N-like [Geotrypetes seraphini]
MAKGFYISKTLAVIGILFSVAAMATVIGLSVALSQEKAKNENSDSTSDTYVGTTTSSNSITMQPSNEIWNKYRLPNSLIPDHYDIELQPHLTKNVEGLYVFKGKSSVIFKCVTATNLILIHSNKLNYTLKAGHHIYLKAVDGSNLPSIQKTWHQTTTQYLVVQLNSNLETGKTYEISSEFRGELADDLAGFYRSEYKEGNETRIIATTQMQPTGARKTFPCFDEPAMKATFNITLIYDPQYTALSNMPNISTTSKNIDGKQWSVTTFDRTPRMSTYLLAFIVSDFSNIEQPGSKPQIRIWARKKAIEENQGEYALNVTGSILNYYDSYYNVSYPLPKSDQIALPDFSAGAMENWGLITYRESALLYDNEISSISNKERVLTVIAHELAHQWFGNLVTLRWWNDLWLNEGFASYVEYLGADFVQKKWNIKDLILLNEMYHVMEIDALSSSHPLSSKEEEVNTPAQINEVFDPIAYSKGSSVIRMLTKFLKESEFKAGLNSYLNAFEYGNAIYSDLWTHLQQAVNASSNLPRSIKEIMDTWTLQMGFPVVTVDTASGKVTQKHFLLDPDSKVNRPSDYNYLWIVPISWMKNGVVQPGYYWLQKSEEINNDFKTSDWVLANINVDGYYRVNYNKENWDKLLKQLQNNHSVIPVMNRAQLISDAFSLARAKYIHTTAALDTTKFLINETEYMPWQTAIGSLDYFKQMFDRTDVYGSMKKYMKQQVFNLFYHFKDVTNNWTVRPSGLMEQYNEVNAISLACTNDLQECKTMASDLFNNWMNNSSYNPIHPNLKTTIYCSAIARGEEKEWDFAWKMFQKATVATEADKLRAALACSTKPWILNRYLQYSLDPTKIRKQDAVSTITYIANNVAGHRFAWDFMRANWKTIYTEFGESSFTMTNLITRMTQRLSTKFDLQQLEQFKLDNQDPGFGSANRAMEQALEKTKANIRWVQENKEAVHVWFNTKINSSL